jgi:dTDP-4-amino-4,6-dideoxygalactose transaminase
MSNVQIPWWSTTFDNGEDNAVSGAVNNSFISQGPLTKEFENQLSEYLNIPHVIAVTSGSDALLLSLLALNLNPGDEVLVPNRTWIATAHAVSLIGAKPIFVDTEKEIPIMKLDDLESKITKKTKAIIPVHMNGHSVDIKELKTISDKYGISIIEDAAQALGSKNSEGKFLGTLGDMGCFSLSVAKIISTGQGGFIATHDKEIAKRLRSMRTHGVENTVEIETWVMKGFNFRFTDILASIGLVQIRIIDERIKHIRRLKKMYCDRLFNVSGIKIIQNKIYEIGPYIEAIVENRPSFINELKKRGIETRPFYPNLSEAPYWKNEIEYPNSKLLSEKGLYLPSGPSLSIDNLRKVISTIEEVLG